MNPVQSTRHTLISRNVNELHDASSTFGERAADAIARFGGSWTFILAFFVVLALWVGLNSLALLVPAFDPYPFIFLNLMLSCLAAIQAPVILMSQNREAARDRLRADHDYAVNVKAELEIEAVHQKLDLLREGQWAELVQMQQRQISLLEHLLDMRGRGPETLASARPNPLPPTPVPSPESADRRPDRRGTRRRAAVVS